MRLSLALCAAAALAACSETTAPLDNAQEPGEETKEMTDTLSAAERGAAFLAENAGKPNVQATNSGLQYVVLEEGAGDGRAPKATDRVEVHYRGTLLDGTEFDSSYARGTPAQFPLNGVISGWTEGVQLMKEGDKYRFFVPSDLAYGRTGTPGGPIGPNETLIFEVELLKVLN